MVTALEMLTAVNALMEAKAAEEAMATEFANEMLAASALGLTRDEAITNGIISKGGGNPDLGNLERYNPELFAKATNKSIPSQDTLPPPVETPTDMAKEADVAKGNSELITSVVKNLDFKPEPKEMVQDLLARPTDPASKSTDLLARPTDPKPKHTLLSATENNTQIVVTAKSTNGAPATAIENPTAAAVATVAQGEKLQDSRPPVGDRMASLKPAIDANMNSVTGPAQTSSVAKQTQVGIA